MDECACWHELFTTIVIFILRDGQFSAYSETWPQVHVLHYSISTSAFLLIKYSFSFGFITLVKQVYSTHIVHYLVTCYRLYVIRLIRPVMHYQLKGLDTEFVDNGLKGDV